MSKLNDMDIEYEATFFPVDRDEIRNRLKTAGAVLVHPDYLMKRQQADQAYYFRSAQSFRLSQ